MKKLLLVSVLAAMPAYGATAHFTGRMEQVQTVTYQIAWNCEYRYLGQTFWRAFIGSCPSSIEIR
jgi:hypothetical protein